MSTINKFFLNICLVLIILNMTLADESAVQKTTSHKSNIKNIENKFTFSKFFESITTIFLSGLFDKSFFITAFMAVKYSKCLVFISASIALSIVGIISVFLGLALTTYVPTFWMDTLAVALFLFFGIKLILEGIHMPKNSQSKFEIEQPVSEENLNLILNTSYTTMNNQNKSHSHSLDDIKKTTDQILKEKEGFKVFLKVFILIFASEIGDRSQISTIYLTNNFDKFVVIISSVISQIILTILAISSGVLISNKISEKNLTIIAGITFLLFGVVALYFLCTQHIDLFLKIAGGNKLNMSHPAVIPDKSLITH